MARLSDFQAAILEESLLYLIRVCGYKEVGRDRIPFDSTLEAHRAGMGIAVKGRGSSHQVDCIGDYIYTPPLCNPIRLLGETKFYGIRDNGSPKKVGIGDIRDAVGLLKDVSEFFSRGNNNNISRRFSYQSVFFSATGFSEEAQDMAYAHDINLISAYGGPSLMNIVNRIRELEIDDFNVDQDADFSLRGFRDNFRLRLRGGPQIADEDNPNERIRRIIQAVIDLDKLFLGTIDNRLTIMMTPAFGIEVWIELVNLALAGIPVPIVLRWNDQPNEAGDLVFRVEANIQNNRMVELFHFLVPKEILKNFLRDGYLGEGAALTMKEQYFSKISVPFVFEGTFSILKLELNMEWLNQIRFRLNNR